MNTLHKSLNVIESNFSEMILFSPFCTDFLHSLGVLFYVIERYKLYIRCHEKRRKRISYKKEATYVYILSSLLSIDPINESYLICLCNQSIITGKFISIPIHWSIMQESVNPGGTIICTWSAMD